MKNAISSVCLFALLAGCATEEGGEDARRVSTMIHRSDLYHVPVYAFYHPYVRQPEQVEITKTEQFMAQRRVALRHRREVLDRAAAAGIAIAPQPNRPPTVAAGPGYGDGPGVGGYSAAPPPSTPAPVLTEPEPISPPARPSAPQPVAEHHVSVAPVATPVAGKPGYVTSPFAPASGYVDVTGFPPGSEARDPYTGKVFRVP